MNSRVLGRLCLLTLLTLVLGAIPVLAQVPTGSIVGTVLDAQKAAVAGAEVTITSQDTGVQYKTTTASNGGYEITNLNFGTYRVEVSAKGFKISVVDNLKLDAATTLSVPPIVLDLGAVTETVTVEGGVELLQTSSAEVDNAVTKDQLEKLPILDRNPLNLLEIVAGVNQNGATVTVINGQRNSLSGFTLDGINIQDNFIRVNSLDFTPTKAILSQTAEFTVNSQNGNPSLGGGSSQVSMVTPRGTNDWHGQGFWYYRSNQWAANDWFSDARGLQNTFLNQNQGGGNVGGPIFKNKLFAYGYYEFLSRDQTQRQSTTVLTGPARNGILTYVPTNSTTGNPITVNLLTLENTNGNNVRPTPPPFTIDPAVAALLARVPTTINDPNVGDGENTSGFDFNARSNERDRNEGVRLDYDANAHNSFSGVYSWNRQVVDRPGIDATFDVVPIVTNSDPDNFLSTAWRWNPNSTLTNEVRFGLNYSHVAFDTTQKFGPNFIDGNTTIFTTPDANFAFQGRDTHTTSWQDNANWVHGNHNVGFGAQIQRITVRSQGDVLPLDLGLGFSPNNPYALQSSDFSQPISSFDLNTANNLLSTLAGFVTTEQQSFNVTSETSGFVPGASTIRNLRMNNWAFYAGDSWRMRPNFTLTYGLRWDYFSPYTEANGLLLQPQIPAGQNIRQVLLTDASLQFVGGSTGRSVYNRDLNNFAPNIGLAWDPWGNGKTSIRAGYTVHFVNDDTIESTDNAAENNPGLSSTPALQNIVSTVSGGLTATGVTPLPALATPAFLAPPIHFSDNAAALGIQNNVGFAVDPNLRTPYVQDWNLSIQRNVGWSTTLTVSYLGNHGASLFRGIDLNQVLIGPNGFLADFNRARSNAFLEQAAGNGFDPQCTNPVPGCQTLTVFPMLPGGGFLGNGTVQNEIRTGQVGTLADIYHVDGIEAFNGQFTPNEFIRGGDLLTNFSNSTYNAGVVQIQRRFKSGLNVQANYVYSKVLTDSSGTQARFSALLDNANPGIEKSRADYDLTHAFKANFFYDLPFGNGQRFSPSSRLLNRLVGGWTVASIFTWQSGAPFSILSARGTLNRTSRSVNETVDSALSISQIRNALGTHFGTGAGQVFTINPAFIAGNGRGVPSDALTCTPLANGFCNPAAGTLGNLGRNAFNGVPFFDQDFSVAKNIKITERMGLLLRADAFNVLNHPVFFVDNQNVNSATFGTSNSTASTPRVLQIGAKFAF